MDEQEEALRTRAEGRVGSTLKGKYRLDRVLGIGGMATVFAATHRNQAELAVKLLHPELSLRDDLRKRFLREGYVGNSVKHPGAVLVVDDDVAEDGSAFLVMELLRGRSLEDVWDRAGRRLPTRAVSALMLQLLEVLAAAHEKAIVHRDLKPANLFLSVDGSLKVLDFGIARLRDAAYGSEHATRTGTLMGTPAFMAPEQAQAIATEIDGQTDLWAVGATMYTMLSGQLVHDGDNSSQLLIKAGTSRARPLLSVAPHVEASIAKVVDRALAFEKTSRWPTAEAMHDALLEAALLAHGRPPGRDDLVSLIEPELRRSDSGPRASGSYGHRSAAPTPRLVVSGGAEIRGNDPTFATPGGSVPPPPTARSSAPLEALPERTIPGPPLPGLSTANPVSAESGRKSRTPVPRATMVAVLAATVAVGAVAFAFSQQRPERAVAAATPSASSAPQTPPPSASAMAAVADVPVTSAATPEPPAPPVATTLATGRPVPTRPAGKAGSSTLKPATAPAVDCTTPYTLDTNGYKTWKVECVQQ